MTFQGVLEPAGQVNQVAEIEGAKLLRTKIHPPWSLTPEVYVLPMENVLATKVRVYNLPGYTDGLD